MTPAISLPANCPAYAGSSAIEETTDGQESNPLGAPKISTADFTAALTSALSGQGLTGGTRHRLNADITDLDQPALSHNTTVGLTARLCGLDYGQPNVAPRPNEKRPASLQAFFVLAP